MSAGRSETTGVYGVQKVQGSLGCRGHMGAGLMSAGGQKLQDTGVQRAEGAESAGVQRVQGCRAHECRGVGECRGVRECRGWRGTGVQGSLGPWQLLI